jgi:hypothetical protein
MSFETVIGEAGVLLGCLGGSARLFLDFDVASEPGKAFLTIRAVEHWISRYGLSGPGWGAVSRKRICN